MALFITFFLMQTQDCAGVELGPEVVSSSNNFGVIFIYVEMRKVANRLMQVLFTETVMYSRLSLPNEQLFLLSINVG